MTNTLGPVTAWLLPKISILRAIAYTFTLPHAVAYTLTLPYDAYMPLPRPQASS